MNDKPKQARPVPGAGPPVRSPQPSIPAPRAVGQQQSMAALRAEVVSLRRAYQQLAHAVAQLGTTPSDDTPSPPAVGRLRS